MIGNDRMMEMETRRASPSDVDRAGEVLGEAFADYAWTRWTVDPDGHQSRVTDLQRLAIRHYGLAFGQVWLTTVDGVVHSVAVWMDSAVAIPAAVQQQLHPVTVELEGSRHEASVAAERELQGWRPDQRHYVLATVGTTPAMRCRGLATRTLSPVLGSADAEGVAAFLETSSMSNVAFYSTFGFEVTDHRRITGGGPDVWALLRQPQAR